MELKNNLTKMRSAITFVLALQLICSGNAFTIFRKAIPSPVQSLSLPLFQPPPQPVNNNENQENSVPVEIAERNSDYNQLEEIRMDLNEIKNVLQNNRIDDKARRLPQECVDAILSRNAQLAYKKLKQIDDPTKINWIVKEVYDDDNRNFDLIANFCDGIDDLEVIIRTYEALGYELIKNNDQMDDLIKKLTELETIHPEIGDVIKKLEIQFVTYNVNSLWHVISKINEQERLEIRILEYEIVLKNILSTKDNINYIQEVVYGLKQTMDNPSFESLDVEIRNKANEIKESLPPCIKNTYFNDKVYIKSIKYNEYLSSPSTQNKNHFVYAKPSRSTWFVTLLENGEYVGFRNGYNEYLSCEFDDDNYDYQGDKEIVTHHSEGNPAFFKEDVMWIIEAEDDNCYLKNRQTEARLSVTDDSHLVSSQKPYTGDDKYLFTIEPSSGDDIDTINNPKVEEPNSIESLISEVFADVSKEKGSVVDNGNPNESKDDSHDNLTSGVSSSDDDIDTINDPKVEEPNSIESLISEVFADIEENNFGGDGTRVTDMYYVDNESLSNERIPETDNIWNDKRISR